MTETPLPFWWQGRVVAVQTAVALVLAVGVLVLAPGTVGYLAAAFLVVSSGLRVLAWHLMTRDRRAKAAAAARRIRPGS